jgi:hypothetical protein
VKPCWLLPQYENRTRLCADLGKQVKVQASQGEIEIAKSVVSEPNWCTERIVRKHRCNSKDD